MLAIPRKQRAMVRKGIKNGLKSADRPQRRPRFFALYADNVHRHGTPAMPKRYFQALMHEVRRRLRGADRHQRRTARPLSSVLSFYFRDEVLPYYAGDDDAARDLAANDFKYWELMRRACARGSRSSTTAAASRAPARYSFKKNWGFEPTPLHYEYCLYKRDAMPQNNPSNAKYQLLIKTWRDACRSPLANWLGPLIVAQPRLSTRYGQPALPGAPLALPAEQGRQGALLPSAQAPGAANHRVYLGTFVDDAGRLSSMWTPCARCAPTCTVGAA